MEGVAELSLAGQLVVRQQLGNGPRGCKPVGFVDRQRLIKTVVQVTEEHDDVVVVDAKLGHFPEVSSRFCLGSCRAQQRCHCPGWSTSGCCRHGQVDVGCLHRGGEREPGHNCAEIGVSCRYGTAVRRQVRAEKAQRGVVHAKPHRNGSLVAHDAKHPGGHLGRLHGTDVRQEGSLCNHKDVEPYHGFGSDGCEDGAPRGPPRLCCTCCGRGSAGTRSGRRGAVAAALRQGSCRGLKRGQHQ
mmetsp:Transcript_8106/g.31940  ORF Transcript_8106/g.31940 Transcript_8106/m.31940 type:complete len:242 (-) Transcript_8106:462-1187(-)